MKIEQLYERARKELINFGLKPIEDVGKILNIVQASNVPEDEVMSLTQDIYIRLFQELKRGDQNQARQSWVVASGNNFEDFIRNFINQSLNSEGIFAIKGNNLKKYNNANDIVGFLTLQAKRRCTQTNTGVWPDSDIIVLTKEKNGKIKAFALLNCKTSDHSRNDAVLFWALALRDNGIKYCLMTQDLDNKFAKGDNDRQISSLRKKAEAYLDRVYSTNPTTQECSQIRKLDFSDPNKIKYFLDDLRSWRREVVPDFDDPPINEEGLK